MPSGCGKLVATGRDSHVWCQGQNSDSLFSTICVWSEAQWQDDIMLNRALRTLSQFLQFQNSWRKSYLVKWVVNCPDPNTQTFCVLGQVICSVLTWTIGQVTWFFLKGLAVMTGKGNGNPLQYSCWENSMNRGAWWAAVHGIAKRVRHDWALSMQ